MKSDRFIPIGLRSSPIAPNGEQEWKSRVVVLRRFYLAEVGAYIEPGTIERTRKAQQYPGPDAFHAQPVAESEGVRSDPSDGVLVGGMARLARVEKAVLRREAKGIDEPAPVGRVREPRRTRRRDAEERGIRFRRKRKLPREELPDRSAIVPIRFRSRPRRTRRKGAGRHRHHESQRNGTKRAAGHTTILFDYGDRTSRPMWRIEDRTPDARAIEEQRRGPGEVGLLSRTKRPPPMAPSR
jgi:hypothetical protein